MPLRIVHRPGTRALWVAGSVRGSRIRESTGTDDPRLAEEYRATREAELYRAAVHGSRAPVALSAVVVSYMEAAPRTAATAARVGRLMRHAGPKMFATQVTQEWLDGACAALLRPGAAPATKLREVIGPARALLLHAARRDWCDAPRLESISASPQRTEWLKPAEADRLMECAVPHLRPLIAFMLATGARLGEALTLEWPDVDLKHARALLRDTKNGRDRPVELCQRALAALRAIEGRTGAVFRTLRGESYKERRVQGGGQIKTGWGRALDRARLDKHVTPHSCRHTWATWHYAMHRDLLRLRAEGDWSSVTLVERYAHLAPATMADEIKTWREGGTILTQTHSPKLSQRRKSLKSGAAPED
jgi:integrase